MNIAKSDLRGFTIIEVMIALAVSGAILAAGITALSSSREDTEFSQAVYDLQSQFQSYASKVSNKVLPGYQNYTCSLSGSGASTRPVLTQLASPSNEETTGDSCIYLGQAIQIIGASDTIYSYPVLGVRTVPNSDPPANPQTVAQAQPEPAVNNVSNPTSFYLTTNYPMLNGLKVDSAYIKGASGTNKDMLAIYSNLQSSNTSGNEITATASTITFNTGDQNSALLQHCVEAATINPPCGSSTDLSQSATWILCVTDGHMYAQILAHGTSAGLSITNSIISTGNVTNDKNTCEQS